MARKPPKNSNRNGRRSPTPKNPSFSSVPRSHLYAWRKNTPLRILTPLTERVSSSPKVDRLQPKVKRFPKNLGAFIIKKISFTPTPNQKRFRENLVRAITQLGHQGHKRQVCKKREERRRALFARHIAGSGAKRSPGKNHTYERTSDSQITCKKRK